MSICVYAYSLICIFYNKYKVYTLRDKKEAVCVREKYSHSYFVLRVVDAWLSSVLVSVGGSKPTQA